MDDILIASRTIQEHCDVLQRIMKRLAENGLELKFQKCKFAYTQIEYLGYLVSEKGIRPSDTHVRAILSFPQPTNVRELKSFLGLSSYFKKFVKKFSNISRPLYALIKDGIKFLFNKECKRVFEIIKFLLTCGPILAIYCPKRETELHCDASALGFGAVLMQKQDDGQFHPVSYFSKRTSEAEGRYHSFEFYLL